MILGPLDHVDQRPTAAKFSGQHSVSAGHPLACAIRHCWKTTKEALGKSYLHFCNFLWQTLPEDLGRNPQPGWNWATHLGPVYLFQDGTMIQLCDDPKFIPSRPLLWQATKRAALFCLRRVRSQRKDAKGAMQRADRNAARGTFEEDSSC